MFCDIVVSNSFIILPKRIQVHSTEKQRLVKMRSQHYRQQSSTCTLASAALRVWTRRRSSSWNQKSSRKCALSTPFIEWRQKPLENELPILAIHVQYEFRRLICVIDTNSDNTILLEAQPGESLNTLPTREVFVSEKALEYCRKAIWSQVGQPNVKVRLDDCGLFIRMSRVAEAVQIVVRESLRNWIPYLSHFLSIAGHSG